MSRRRSLCIPNDIRRYRKYRHLRLRDIAADFGFLNSAHISLWERGKKLPTLTNALKLSAVLKTPVEVMFCGYFNQLRNEIEKNKRQTNTKSI